jgi:hypothetical protein
LVYISAVAAAAGCCGFDCGPASERRNDDGSLCTRTKVLVYTSQPRTKGAGHDYRSSMSDHIEGSAAQKSRFSFYFAEFAGWGPCINDDMRKYAGPELMRCSIWVFVLPPYLT